MVASGPIGQSEVGLIPSSGRGCASKSFSAGGPASPASHPHTGAPRWNSSAIFLWGLAVVPQMISGIAGESDLCSASTRPTVSKGFPGAPDIGVRVARQRTAQQHSATRPGGQCVERRDPAVSVFVYGHGQERYLDPDAVLALDQLRSA